MSRGLLGVLLTCAAALALVPVELGAQGQGAHPLMVKHRNDCRLAAQVLTTSEPHTKRDWAQGVVPSCESQVAVPALLSWWSAETSNLRELSRLHSATRGFRDRQLYDAMLAVVRNESQHPLRRIAALGVLASYVDERMTLSLRLLEPTQGVRGRWNSVWSLDNHSHQEPGAHPLPRDARSVIVALAHVLKGESQEQVRQTAKHLTYFSAFGSP